VIFHKTIAHGCGSPPAFFVMSINLFANVRTEENLHCILNSTHMKGKITMIHYEGDLRVLGDMIWKPK
jgi:hypothetical protein